MLRNSFLFNVKFHDSNKQLHRFSIRKMYLVISEESTIKGKVNSIVQILSKDGHSLIKLDIINNTRQ